MRTETVLARRREERQERIDRARRFADALPVRPHAVIVFGSVARGDFNRWSDVDVLVIVDAAAGPSHRRADALGPAPGGVQVVVWTPREFAAQRDRGNPIVRESLDRGIWLVGNAAALP